MKIEEIRTSFTVYVVAGTLERFDGIAESLRLAGYMVANFTELTSAFSEFPSNPPHFLIFDAAEKSFNLKKAIKQVAVQLPESHIFLLVSFDDREQVLPLLEHGVYDFIYSPVLSQVELLRALDRAAERDYFMYLNERLSQAQPPPSAPPSASGPPDLPPLPSMESSTSNSVTATSSIYLGDPGNLTTIGHDFHLTFARQLFDQKSPDECLNVFLRAASAPLGSCGAMYFKYIANRRVLLAAQSQHITGVDFTGLGVDFNASGTAFKVAQLRDPHSIEELNHFVKEVFDTEDYFALPVESLGEVQGLALFLRSEPGAAVANMLRDWLVLLSKALGLLEAEKRMHVMSVKDVATDVLNRQNFLVRAQQEVSRSRRTQLPVSLALLAIDQYGQIVAKMGQEEAQTLLRMTARIFEKHSRVNDVIGRTGADEFGILLPNTSKQGAMIKSERLRRIIETADFSKVVKNFSSLTISIGVSEYPSFVRDAEELIETADQALYQVRQTGNKTCIANAPQGFVPDFQVQDKGLS